MSWLSKYRVRLYTRNSLWILPTLSIIVALVMARLVISFELAMGWQSTISRDTARPIMTTVAASTLRLGGVVSSAMLLAVQLASAQLTPRIISLIYRSPYGKLAFSVFVFTFTFSVATLVRIEDAVPLIAIYVAAYGFLVSLALFIVFTDTMGKMLRPSSALRRLGLAGREVISTVYPAFRTADSQLPEPFKLPRECEPRVISNDTDGAVLAFDMAGIVSKATKTNCVIELMPQVGDFVVP